MPRTSKIEVDNWDYTVSAKPLIYNEDVIDSFKLIVREDRNKVLAVMKQTYGVVQNRDVITLAEETFQDSSFDLGKYERKVITSGNGARMMANYSFEKTLEVAPDDHHKLTLTVVNSHDGSYPVMMSVGSIRIVCFNQMKSIRKGLVVTAKHTNRLVLDDFRITLGLALDQAAEMTGLYKKMSLIELPQDRGESLIKQMTEKRVFSERVSKGILEVWKTPRHKEDKGRNLYNLLNAVTDYATHDISEDRYELAERVTRNATEHLSQLATVQDI